MTSLRELLDEIANRAEPADGLADRALARADRRRRTWFPTVTAAVAVASVVALVAVAYPIVNRPADERRPGDNAVSNTQGPITLPTKASPLPSDGVGPVGISYQRTCGYGDMCSAWRVMTIDGRHYSVPGAVSDKDHTGGVFVSPDGKRIAYVRKDGALVLRDLASGSTRELLNLPRGRGITEHSWSADGRWLVATESVDCGVDGSCRAPSADAWEPTSTLIDTRTGQRVELGDGEPLGVTNGRTAPFPFGTADASTDGGLRLVDHDGRTVDPLPGGLVKGVAGDGVLGAVSPDGRLLTAITFPGGAGSESKTADALISLVDVRRRTTVRTTTVKESWMDWDSPRLEGWSDAGHVVLSTNTLKGVDRNAPGNPGNDVVVDGANVDLLDVKTLTTKRALTIEDTPAGLDVAYRAVASMGS